MLDVHNKGYLTVDTFANVFKNLGVCPIGKAGDDEDIFLSIADQD